MALADKLARVNLIAPLFIVASVSVGLGNAGYWFIFLAVVGAAVTIAGWRDTLRSVMLLWPALALLVFYFVYSLLVTRGEPVTATPLNVLAWIAVIPILTVCYLKWGLPYFERGLRHVLYVLVACALFGILESIIRYNPLILVYEQITGAWRMGTPSYRASAIFAHALPFAHMMVLGLILAFVLLRSTVWKLAVSAVLVVAIIGTQTRSALIVAAFVATLAVVQVTVQRRRYKMLFWYVALLVALGAGTIILARSGLIGGYAAGIFDRLANLGSGDISVGQRLATVDLTITTFFTESSPIEMIFGHGFAMSNVLISSVPLLIENFTTTDNYWVTILFDFGLLGFVGFVFVIGTSLYMVVRMFVRPSGDLRKQVRENKTVATAMCYILFATLLFMFFYSFTKWRGVQFMLIMCVLVLYFAGSTRLTEMRSRVVPGVLEIPGA